MKVIEDIFNLVEAPVDRAGYTPDFVDGVASQTGSPDALARILHRVFRGGIRARIEGRQPLGCLFTTRPTLENGDRSIQQRNVQHRSHPFARNPMLGHPSSPSRVRFAALQNARALDRSGRATRSPGYERKGSYRNESTLM
jgi:hypothetical protein